MDNGCESCHFFREDGTYSGAPKLAQCVQCHEEANSEDPEEIKFVEQYVKKEREVPWLVYSRQPDCVFFSHAAHVKMADMDCVTCHGPIGESESLRPYQENRISGYSRDIWGKQHRRAQTQLLGPHEDGRLRRVPCQGQGERPAACRPRGTDASSATNTACAAGRFADGHTISLMPEGKR